MKRNGYLLICLILALLPGCKTARVTSETRFTAPAGPPKTIYISDFELGAYQVATDATSGSAPGGAPTLLLTPYGVAARFLMAGNDVEKNVRETAAKIATRVAEGVAKK